MSDLEYHHAATLYLELLKKALSRSLFDANLYPVAPKRGTLKNAVFTPIQKMLATRRMVLARANIGPETFAQSPPAQVRDAETLIGPVGLDNVQHCVEDVLRRNVPGDFIETGVWRGGAVIFMRGILEAYGDTTRRVWAADSFQGLPSPDVTRYAADAGDEHWASEDWLTVSLDEVKRNFARYGLLDDRVRFLAGWFHETLPSAAIEQLAVMRLDGDMYSSTMDALQGLYPRLVVGGYVIIDDYWLPNCRAAVEDYRAGHGITEEIVPVDRAIVYWQRAR